MKNLNLQLKIVLFLFLALPLTVLAKETIGDYILEFDEKIETDTDGNGQNDRTSYYKSNVLVWSAFDDDENGEPDLWLRYKNGDTVDLEISDPDGDGNPDKMAEFDYQGKRELIYDSDAKFADNSSSVMTYVLIIGILTAAGAWYYLRTRKARN